MVSNKFLLITNLLFTGLSYLKDPLWVIPLEILELFTINLMQVTAATLTYKLAPKTLVATAQGLVWISHFGIGKNNCIIPQLFYKQKMYIKIKTIFVLLSENDMKVMIENVRKVIMYEIFFLIWNGGQQLGHGLPKRVRCRK